MVARDGVAPSECYAQEIYSLPQPSTGISGILKNGGVYESRTRLIGSTVQDPTDE
jgi:hypothetical protein